MTRPSGPRPSPEKDPFAVAPPALSLPKGGGAIRGIAEKFAANPVTGTGSMSVPIPTSAGRSGFGPELALSYDSGAGNGPFGWGWNLSVPSITRKTDKGLPKYQDAAESDVFMLSGAEDLVPVGRATDDPLLQFHIQRYRPRIEGLFALIERWTDRRGQSHWRSISKDNITTVYGRDAESRIVDPADPTRIFSWLICERSDDRGNAIRYQYKAESPDGIDLSATNEKNRHRTAQRYLKRIKYGNRTPRLPNDDLTLRTDWMFEVVFDYGEHYPETGTVSLASVFAGDDGPAWTTRQDPFSAYRAGFEVRTYRLCRRVLMFHHFSGELGTGDCLVRATHFRFAEGPAASFITAVTQSSYLLPPGESEYLQKSLPPLEFEYSQATVDETVREIDEESLENLPEGLDGSRYRWVDLDGEGLSGILTEQGGAWFYKRNLGPSPIDGRDSTATGIARFAPAARLPTIPSPAALSGGQQLLDLAGDGRLDVVAFDRPLPGFFERTHDGSWEPFAPFTSLPNVDWKDPNLRFVDLTGDGHADVLIAEDDVFTWYPSLAEQGFGPASEVRQTVEDDTGPRLLFADGTQSVYLSDMSGDGLADLVRIRNGDVCYWPNLGYGRFGAKVSMDNAPLFDTPDQFDQKRIRLADIDGSGTIDIVYLGHDGVHLYFNRSGNRWSAARTLDHFPRIDNLASVTTADLLGSGTACLVWSSPLPGDAQRQMRYIDLMGGQKPYLLVRTSNNLGARTEVEYTPSTTFYLADKRASRPWITKLPFPVHCVAKVTAIDEWRNTRFATTYSYHHGYFDGREREFRGFGRVEQVDVEDYGHFAQGNVESPYITQDRTLYQPPIKTITWYHTGAALDRERMLTQFATEYFPTRYPQPGGVPEKTLPEPVLDAGLGPEEWREGLRACKGMVLRQEIYELDVDALHATPSAEVPVRLFSAAAHNCRIHRLQPKGGNQHAVFLVTESELLNYHYELDLRPAGRRLADPRIVHTLNLRHDEYGNLQQAVTIAYGRRRPGEHAGLPRADLIDQVQAEPHLSYTETRYTKDVVLPTAPVVGPGAPVNHYRLRLPCEVLTYELKGIGRAEPLYYGLSDFQELDLSEQYGHEDPATIPAPPRPVALKEYHEYADGLVAQKRVIEHLRTLYFKDEDGIDQPDAPHDFGRHGPRGLKYEDYKLALTDALLDKVFQRSGGTGQPADALLAWPVEGSVTVRDKLDERVGSGSAYLKSGYIRGAAIDARLIGQYWLRSGTAGFAADAAAHFYLPERYTDPFGNVTTLHYDPLDLFLQSSQDAMGNTSGVLVDPNTGRARFDYRVLAPIEIVDPNGNHSEVRFDTLGLVVAAAVKGKQRNGRWEGDHLEDFSDALANPPAADVAAFCAAGTLDTQRARDWLASASARFVYHFGDRDGLWAQRPAGACAIARERHVGQLPAGAQSPLHVSLECSDGTGTVLMKKVQAEPDPESTAAEPPLRWIVNGLTVLNNKGKPVKQYEPAFSPDFGCERPHANGVTSVKYYDAAGRLLRTEMPDGTLSRIEFSPWQMTSYDANDTVKESRWYRERLTASERGPASPAPDAEEELKAQRASAADKRAARLAAEHADTPALTILDSLGRAAIAIAHNREKDAAGTWHDDRYATFTKLDAEGKPLWIRDARGNMVMQYITPPQPTSLPAAETEWLDAERLPPTATPCYDVAGNLLFQHGMDAGDRWTLMDAGGKAMAAWDFNRWQQPDGTFVDERRLYFTEYDALHRVTAQWLGVNGAPRQMIERFEYRDTLEAGAPNARLAADRAANVVGELVRHFDPGGLSETVRCDFKGNVLEAERRLNNQPAESMIDWRTSPLTRLESETFRQLTEYDAVNRVTLRYNWHRDPATVAAYQLKYNRRGALQSEKLRVRAGYSAAGPVGGVNAAQPDEIQEIRYNAKGQQELVRLGNGTISRYDYDRQTFHLQQVRTTRLAPADIDPGFPGFASNLSDARVVQQLHYTYDPVGNITEVHDDAYEPVFFQNQMVEPRSRFEYDALYRLTSAAGRENGALRGAPMNLDAQTIVRADFPVQPTDPKALRVYTQTYRYDPAGNIVRLHHGAGAGTWTRRFRYADDSNRLLATWDTDDGWPLADPTVATRYELDAHGNMRNLARLDPRFNLQWDHRDTISGIDLGGGGTAHYQYDAGKQRTRKRIVNENGLGGYSERIYLAGYELYRRYNTTGTAVVEEVESHHLLNGEARVLLVDDVVIPAGAAHPRPDGLRVPAQTRFRYQYSNHLGSVGLELDQDAGIISYEEFHPYGTSAYRAVKRDIEAAPKRYRYTGMERDDESGLGYHGARYYASWLGRWTACDPLGMADGPNLYAYAQCNPVIGRDPDGTMTFVEAVGSLREGIERLQHYAENPEDMFGSARNPREFGLVRNLVTGERSIVQGGRDAIYPTAAVLMEAHSHHDQDATPSGGSGDLGYIARNFARRHEIRAPRWEGISRAVITRDWFRSRLTVRGYQGGLEVLRRSYDVSDFAAGQGSPPNAQARLLSEQVFPTGSLRSRIAVSVQQAATGVRAAVTSAGRSATESLRTLPGRVAASVRSGASSAVQAVRANPRAVLTGVAGTTGGVLARSFIPGADAVLNTVAQVGVRNTASLAARAAAPLLVVAAGAAAGYVVGDAVERVVTRETGSRTAGVVAGTGAGVLAGAAAGAAVGAAIGALGFGIGAVPGAAIGAAAGAVAGFIGAYW